VDYNRMVRPLDLYLSANEVWDYGRQFLALTRFYDVAGYYFLDSTAHLIAINRSRRDAGQLGIHKPSSWETEVARMRKACSECRFRYLLVDRLTGDYLVDYCVWLLSSGDLVHVRLAVSKDGACRIVEDSTIAHGLGYWEERRY
jgi:hypothetical protein